MTEFVLTLQGEVMPKGRPRFSSSGKRSYTPARTRNYEKKLRARAEYLMRNRPLLQGPLECDVLVTMVLPRSWTKDKKRDAMWGIILPDRRPDWDNFAKVLDALNGVVFVDDGQIVNGRVVKRYGAQPGIAIRIRPARPIAMPSWAIDGPKDDVFA